MNPFEFQCKTKLIFGEGTENKAGEELKAQGVQKVLLVYGGKSIKRSGLYDRVISAMDASDITYMELPGVGSQSPCFAGEGRHPDMP